MVHLERDRLRSWKYFLVFTKKVGGNVFDLVESLKVEALIFIQPRSLWVAEI